MSGIFIAVVGPSGVGKDTLIARAKERLGDDRRFSFPARWITRRPDQTERSLELDRAEWLRRREGGECALAWEAHGIAYAIPGDARAEAASGRAVVANVSRGVLEEAARNFPRCAALAITAPTGTIAERLAERGREDEAGRMRRLRRAPRPLPPGMAVVEIENGGPLDRAVASFIEALERLALERAPTG